MRSAIVVGATVLLLGLILILGWGDSAGPNAYVVIGVTTGAIYGLVAIGLVLIYKGSRVFNFAQGEFGTMAAFILYVLVEQVQGVQIPYGVAVGIALLGAVVIGLFMERVVVRPLINAPRITLLVATIAFALFLVGLELLLFLPEAKALPPLLQANSPSGEFLGVSIFDYNVEPQQILIVAVLGALAVGLGYFFTRTDLGLAILATSQDAFATRVVGIGVERISRVIWVSAAFLGAIAGILYIPVQLPLAPGVMTSQALIPAFTGAVIGGMTSLPGAFVGGVVVGVVQSFSLWAVGHYHFGERAITEVIPGAEQVSVLVVMLAILLARPQGLLGKEA